MLMLTEATCRHPVTLRTYCCARHCLVESSAIQCGARGPKPLHLVERPF